MSKKQKTTGGPRARRLTHEDLRRRREYKSHAERERMWQRIALISIGALVLVSVLVLLGSIAYQNYLVPRQAISTVNGTKISTQDFQDRMRFQRWQDADNVRNVYYMVGGNVEAAKQYAQKQLQNLQFPSLAAKDVLDNMENEILLEQGAKELGVTVNEDEVQQHVNEFVAQSLNLTLPGQPTNTPTSVPSDTPTPLVSPTPSNTPLPTETPTAAPSATPALDEEGTPLPTATATPVPTATLSPTPTPTLESDAIVATVDAAAENWLGEAKKSAGIDRDVLYKVMYYDMLRKAVQDKLAEDIPTEMLQVNTRHILFAFNPDHPNDPTPPTDEQIADAKARAEAALQALQDGEPFATLAAAVSDDTGSAANGGELGWSPTDKYDPDFADAVLNAEIGEIVGPVQSQFGFHIIQVHAREVRPLSDSEFLDRKNKAYQEWLQALKDAADIQRRDKWIKRAIEEPTYDQLLGDILPLQ